MVIDPIAQTDFRFIAMSVVGLGISEVMCVTIGKAVLTVTDVAIGFSRLFFCRW